MRLYAHLLTSSIFLLLIRSIYSINVDVQATTESLLEHTTVEHRNQNDELANLREQLKVDREIFEEEKRQMQKSGESTDVFRLNVGGELIMTTRATLSRVPKSLLATMFNGRWEHKLGKDRDGNIFLDLNPILFRHLLEQLRVLESVDRVVFHPPSTASLVKPFKKMLRKLGLDPRPQSQEDIITLNVGGEQVTTRQNTLTRVPRSKLATIIFYFKAKNIDANGNLFLDYNPKLFRHLLGQLREDHKWNTHRFEAPSKNEREAYNVMLMNFNLGHLGNNLCDNAIWDRNGTTVAGGNGVGSDLNQLRFPRGMFVNDDGTVYVADTWNNRIVKWVPGALTGQVMAGSNDEGSDSNQFNLPTDVVADKNETMFICDQDNKRVQRWFKNDHQAETIIPDVDCYGLAMDKHESLYISDYIPERVLEWPSGEVVAGGNGQGSALNQLSIPRYIFVDQNLSVFVAEQANHRVVKWPVGAKEGIVVAGGNEEGNGTHQLQHPYSVVADQMGTVYVADWNNNRIMRWTQGSKTGTVLIGGQGGDNRPDQLNHPTDLALDGLGNLYVVDSWNQRIQMFSIDKRSCTEKST